MSFISVASHKLFFKDVQSLDSKPLATLLLVHGAGGSHVDWRRQFTDLSARFRVIALDLPEHGASEGVGEATIRGYAEVVIELIDSLGLERVVLGGHSMGGGIALEVALRSPAHLSGLVLVGSGARLRVLPVIFSLIREDLETAIQGMANFTFSPDAPLKLIEEEKEQLARNSAELLIRDFTACDSFDVMDKVGSIRLPTLIISGKDDRLTPAKYSEFLHDKIKGSEFVLLENSGHMPQLEQSSEFNRTVLSFLTRLK